MITAASDLGISPLQDLHEFQMEQRNAAALQQFQAVQPPVPVHPVAWESLDRQYRNNLVNWLLGKPKTRDLLAEAVDAALNTPPTTVVGSGFIGPFQVEDPTRNSGGAGGNAGGAQGGVVGKFGDRWRLDPALLERLNNADIQEMVWNVLIQKGVDLYNFTAESAERQRHDISIVLYRGGLTQDQRDALVLLSARISAKIGPRPHIPHGFGDL